jgi:hypothetical protein
VAVVCAFAGEAQSAAVGARAVGRLLEDGHFAEQWNGHLGLHLHDVEWQLPWSELLSLLLALDVALALAAVALALTVRIPARRAVLFGFLAPVTWWLAFPIDLVGWYGRDDEPSSIEVHILCTHPVEGMPPGLFAIGSSWFAGC